METTKYLTLAGLQHIVGKLYARGFNGMGLSQENFTTALLNKLNSTATTEGLSELNARLEALESLIEADSNGAINKFNEIVAFLDGIEDTQTLAPVIADVAANKAGLAQRYTKEEADKAFQPKGDYLTEHQDITGKVDKVAGKELSSNDYTDADKAAVATIGGKLDAADVVAITDAEIDAILAGE